MPLETATYISDLVITNPANSDGLNQADDHMRLLKSTVKATFPNFTAAALSATQAQLDAAVAAVVTRANATVPSGAIMDFGMASAPAGWLACDGTAVSRATYADLYAAIGTTWGAGDGSTTFNVPNMLSRYRRHRDNSTLSGTVGTSQGPCNLAHTHTGSGTTGFISNDHTHTYSGSGTTGTDSPDHSHTTAVAGVLNGGSVAVGGGGSFFLPSTQNYASGGASARHAHGFSWSGTTSGVSSNHTHNYSFTTSGGSADNAAEVRPYSATVLTCIKY